jgi:predicted DNA-binding transcriptional regulator AlpA
MVSVNLKINRLSGHRAPTTEATHRVIHKSQKKAACSRPSWCLAAKARQVAKIKELGAALAADGFVTLDEQARALGLSRSTAWAVLKANHKASGLAAGTINQMLSSPELPPHVRGMILTYVEEKFAGLYGHNKTQLRRFAAGSLFAGNVLVATIAWIIVTLVH